MRLIAVASAYVLRERHYFTSSGPVRQKLQAFLIHGVGTVASFALILLLARLLTASEFGRYSATYNTVLILATIATLGFNTLNLREISVGMARKQTSNVAQITLTGALCAALSSFAIILLYSTVSAFLSDNFSVSISRSLSWLLLVTTLSLLMVLQSALLGLQTVARALIPLRVALPSGTIFLVFFYSHFSQLTLDHRSTLFLLSLSAAAALLYSVFSFLRELCPKVGDGDFRRRVGLA